MPTNDQIIEAARKKLTADTIITDLYDGVSFKVSFFHQTPDCRTREPVSVTLEEAEAVALDQNQEHDHAASQCDACRRLVALGVSQGRSSLSRLDRDDVVSVLVDSYKNANWMQVSFSELADAICAKFAAPDSKLERFDVDQLAWHLDGMVRYHGYPREVAKHIAATMAAPALPLCTEEEANVILNSCNDKLAAWNNPFSDVNRASILAAVINEVFAISSPEQEDRCPDCDHKDGAYRDPEDDDITMFCGWKQCNCVNRFHRDRGVER